MNNYWAAAPYVGQSLDFSLRNEKLSFNHLLAANEKPKTVSENMGHASVAFTLNTYAHVLPSMQSSAAVRLEKILKS